MRHVIDVERSSEINNAFYSSRVDLPFRTEAARQEHQFAVAKLLYNYIKEISGKEEIKIIELGARGVYFERGLYSGLKHFAKEELPNITYTIIDISPLAIENSKLSYSDIAEHGDKNIFPTRFFAADVLNREEVEIAGKGYDVVIANELIDDIPQEVIAKRDGVYYEVLFELTWTEWAEIGVKRHGMRALSEEEVKELERYVYMEDGQAITYSPKLGDLVKNVASLMEKEGMLFIHDYFITNPVPLEKSVHLKRVYGNIFDYSALSRNPESGELQITADVNLMQLLFALGENGFACSMASPHELFLNEMFEDKIINLRTLALSLNALDLEKRRSLLAELKRTDDIPRDAKKVDKSLLKELNSILRKGALELRAGAFYAPNSKVDISYLVDDKEKLAFLYSVYRDLYAIKNPYMDIAATLMH